MSPAETPGGSPLIIKPRLAAAHSLEKIMTKNHFSNMVTAEWLNKTGWSSEDQGLYLRLVYGTLEQIMLIDAVLQKHAARSISDIDSSVRGILRISAYQILFADRIPAYAIINEAVELIKSKKSKAAGFVNAVLRSILREKEKAPDRESYLKQICQQQPSLCYSHPDWLIQRLRNDFAEENVIKILEAHQKPPDLTIRLNLLKGNPELLVQKIGQDGIVIEETGWLPEAYQVTNSTGLITRSAAYHNGLFQIQSIVSMLAVHWLDPQPGEKIVDVAAAPGGKTTHIAQRMKNLGFILACDLSSKRIRQVDLQARRLGCEIIQTQVQDGLTPDPSWKGRADRVLLDAPCSSMGMIRKKPELKLHKTEKEVLELPDLQKQLLANSAELVKPGGILLYATCTYFHMENRQIIETFLDQQPDYSLQSLESLPDPMLISSAITNEGMIQMGPHLHEDLDGFFVAKLRRRSD